MGKVRWAGVGCATLFALPFCAAGIAVIFSAPRSTGRDLVMRVGAGRLAADHRVARRERHHDVDRRLDEMLAARIKSAIA